MEIKLPEFCLVALVGVSGSGKSTFGRRHFASTEVLSSDRFRGLVADDENDQAASGDAFDALYHVAGIRLRNRRLTVVDATHTQRESRAKLVDLARQYHALPVAIVLDVPTKVCVARNERRSDRSLGKHVIPQQASQLRRSLRSLRREGFRSVFVLSSEDEVDGVSINRVPLWTDKRDENGPFDIIGDVHGCFEELLELLTKLGYSIEERPANGVRATFRVAAPVGRKAIFLGDLVDRGPRSPDVLRLAMDMVRSGVALCIPGNHEVKLLKKLNGKSVGVGHGLAETLEQLEAVPEDTVQEFREFIDGLVSHYVLDSGKLVVAHAGLKEELQGRASKVVRSFALYGDTTGEIDEFGLPVRHPWASEYRGDATVVYGHTPTPEAEWLNRTICIDTGCVFGGKLTALRYPELELVSIPAGRVYSEPVRPLEDEEEDERSAQQANDDLLHLEDVSGKRIISTRLRPSITVREENAAAALEVMSRFAVDPHWLIYLPPTMSPSETSQRESFLEYPAEAFDHFRSARVDRVVCEEKHMGSRAVVIVCKDDAVAVERFGLPSEAPGVCYTRTGRAFFHDAALETAFLLGVRDAMAGSGLWDDLATDWVCLDCELMPWSAKARALLLDQYAPTGAAGLWSLDAAVDSLKRAEARGAKVEELVQRYGDRQRNVAAYVDAYRQYCWPVTSLADYRLAPFHILATENGVHVEQDHLWHMQMAARLADAAPGLLLATSHRVVDLADIESVDAATGWWTELTGAGGEGMVIKPIEFVRRGPRGLVQPALKCRGPEYLRIIYGAEYRAPEHLERLRQRGLNRKRSLAIREFVLGVEALERFVRREPLRRVHECVFGVLALESEPVDPRL